MQRARILHAAMELFLDEGFDRVSVEKIASEARVSKSAIYDQFGGKEPLFDAVIGFCCEDVEAPSLDPLGEDFDLRDVLLDSGRAAAFRILQPKALKIIRLALGAYAQNPKLAKIFWEHGPMRAAHHVAEAISRKTARARRRKVDAHALSIAYLNECVGAFFFTTMLGVTRHPTQKQIDLELVRITDDFLERHKLA